MIEASRPIAPCSSSAAPRPALNTGSSSSTITAACTAASASPPAASTACPAATARRTPSPARSCASSGQRPAPPCTTIATSIAPKINGARPSLGSEPPNGGAARRAGPPNLKRARSSLGSDLRSAAAALHELPVGCRDDRAVAGPERRLQALTVEPLRADHDRGPDRSRVEVAQREVEPPGDERACPAAGANARAAQQRVLPARPRQRALEGAGRGGAGVQLARLRAQVAGGDREHGGDEERRADRGGEPRGG